MTFPAAVVLGLLILLSNVGIAKEGGPGFYEGLSFSTVGFSKENKTVLVEVNDYQRGTYISVYKTRNGEKIRDYRVEAGKTKAKLKALSRKGVMDDPGEPGAVSPKDGTTITGIFNGRDMALQVQAGTTLGFWTSCLYPQRRRDLTSPNQKYPLGFKERRWRLSSRGN